MPQNEVIPIECFRCGVCCIKFQAPVDDDEISTVAAALGLSGHDFILTHLQDTPMGYLIRHGERGCTFLDFEKSSGLATCRIHVHRPDACRRWQASLSKQECQKGLAEMNAAGIKLPDYVNL